MKQKIRHILGQKTKPLAWLAALAVFCLGFGMLNIFTPAVNAQQAGNYKPEDIQFELTLNDNFFRVYDVGGSVPLTATLKLIKPDQLVLGALNDNASCVTVDNSPCSANRVTGLNLGLVNKTQNAQLCNTTRGAFDCDYPLLGKSQSPNVIKKGDILSFDLSTSSDNYKLLALNSSDSGTINEVYVYPILSLSRFNVSSQNGGKSVFIQSYKTADEYNANKNNPRPDPSVVPPNGSVTGSPSLGKTGSPLLGLVNDLINIIAALIKQFIYWIFYLLVAPLIQGMLSIHTYTDAFAAVIYPGWEVVRNICNILFVVALIAIGLGTLFRIESYQYKHLLVDLIIAALLVNFSLVIAQAILGVADTVQSQFLPNNVDVIRGLARDLMAGGWDKITITNLADAGFFANSIQPLFSLGLALGSFVVFAAIAGFLFVRIVMLWVLLMLSPLAYAMRVLPQTKSYAGKWWSEFIKYAFFTPIMAFFLNMAAVINNSYKNNPIFTQVSNDPTLIGASADSSGVATFAFRVGGNFIILIFLVVAIKVAEQAGVYGADIVAKTAQKGLFAPFTWTGGKAKAGGEMLGGYLNRKRQEITAPLHETGLFGSKKLGKAVAVAANLDTFKKAFKKRGERKSHQAEEAAEGAMANIVSGLPFFKEPSLNDFEHAYLHMAEEAAKNLPKGSERVSLGVVTNIFQTAKTDQDTQIKLLGAITNLAEQRGMNALMLKAKELGIQNHADPNGVFKAGDTQDYIRFMNAIKKKFKIPDSVMAGYMAKLSKVAYDNDEFWYAETTNVDHHGHAQMILTDDNDKILGEEEYKSIEQILEHDDEVTWTDKKGKQHSFNVEAEVNEQVRKWEEEGEGKNAKVTLSTEEFEKQKATFTLQARQKARKKFRGEVLENLESTDEHSYELYQNYNQAINGPAEAMNNFYKLNPRERAFSFHWNGPFVVDEGGVANFNPIGFDHTLSLGGAELAQSANVQIKKSQAFVDLVNRLGRPKVIQLLSEQTANKEINRLKNVGVSKTDLERYRPEVERQSKSIAEKRLEIAENHYYGGVVPKDLETTLRGTQFTGEFASIGRSKKEDVA